jgi:hypothetical protein
MERHRSTKQKIAWRVHGHRAWLTEELGKRVGVCANKPTATHRRIGNIGGVIPITPAYSLLIAQAANGCPVAWAYRFVLAGRAHARQTGGCYLQFWLPNFAPTFFSCPSSKPRDSNTKIRSAPPHCVHERGGPGVKNKNCVKVVVYMHDTHMTHTWWS